MRKMKNRPDGWTLNEPSTYRPGSASGGIDYSKRVLYTPVVRQPQPKHSNTEEIDAVVETGWKLLSTLFWGGCFIGVKVLLDLPDALDRAQVKREARRRKK
jgi:hypothetical protein